MFIFLEQHRPQALDNQDKFGVDTAETLLSNFYVDDMLKSKDDLGETISLMSVTKETQKRLEHMACLTTQHHPKAPRRELYHSFSKSKTNLVIGRCSTALLPPNRRFAILTISSLSVTTLTIFANDH